MHIALSKVKSKRTPMPCNMHIMVFDDRPDEAKRLEQARIARGFPDAKSAAKFFGWNYYTYVQHENGTRGISRAAEKYASAFRVSPGWLLTGEGSSPRRGVPLKGKVGAGAEVEAIDNGDVEIVEAPSRAPLETVAVRVTGDSMFPAYEDGTLLYYSRQMPPDAMINKRCIAELSDGRIFVKVLRQGSEPNTWTLQSLNPHIADIPNQFVRWAAPIDWIKPV